MTAPLQLGEVIGRQPAQVRITPSQVNPWYGSARDGDRFTANQLHTLATRHLDPETVDTITVRREATDREMYWGIGQRPPVFEFECPVLNRRADGRIMVIAPAGFPKIVLGDGWVRAPRGRIKRSLW